MMGKCFCRHKLYNYTTRTTYWSTSQGASLVKCLYKCENYEPETFFFSKYIGKSRQFAYNKVEMVAYNSTMMTVTTLYI